LPPCCQHATVKVQPCAAPTVCSRIIQILRRLKRPVTAAALAAELETSKRSVYRDIAALIGQRVPIRGEAGLGYVLESGFD
jgi:predicted DNA-binding transcriptional regulator YafY